MVGVVVVHLHEHVGGVGRGEEREPRVLREVERLHGRRNLTIRALDHTVTNQKNVLAHAPEQVTIEIGSQPWD